MDRTCNACRNWTFQLPHLKKKGGSTLALLSKCVTGAVRNINNQLNRFLEDAKPPPLLRTNVYIRLISKYAIQSEAQSSLHQQHVAFWTVWRVSDDKGSKCSPCSSVSVRWHWWRGCRIVRTEGNWDLSKRNKHKAATELLQWISVMMMGTCNIVAGKVGGWCLGGVQKKHTSTHTPLPFLCQITPGNS